VQTIIPLPGHGAIRLTTARYYTPSGRSIQALGIHPDLIVEPAKIEAIEQPQFRSEAELRGALENDNGTNGSEPPATGEAPAIEGVPDDADPEDLSNDYQLLRAVDLLRGLALFKSAQAAN
jgi:carboxyl-terminal processing protease